MATLRKKTTTGGKSKTAKPKTQTSGGGRKKQTTKTESKGTPNRFGKASDRPKHAQTFYDAAKVCISCAPKADRNKLDAAIRGRLKYVKPEDTKDFLRKTQNAKKEDQLVKYLKDAITQLGGRRPKAERKTREPKAKLTPFQRLKNLST
jgi:hypothetical protein